MIIVNLKGGLGNQMFQYALGRKLAQQTGHELKLDLTGYDRNHYRAFDLDVFNIVNNPASQEEIRGLKYPYGWLSKGWRGFKFKILRVHHTGWEPRTLAKIEKQLTAGHSVYLDGYWQSYKYFTEIRETLLKEFSLKTGLAQTHSDLLAKITSTNSVALAIRRTDYLWPKNLKSIGICSVAYYQKAIDLISAKVEDPTFFVITDDLDWAKANLKSPNPIIFVSELRQNNLIDHRQEMMLISQCQHSIIANSSFSWWPTWLNNNPQQIAIAPDIWFSDNSIKIDDIVPPTWIRLPRD